MDSKAACITCKHPGSEHSVIEGLDGRGHCKVPGCGCGAFVVGATPSAPQAKSGMRHTIFARATNADGTEGCQLTASGPGSPTELSKPMLEKLADTVRAEYLKLFDCEADQVGITALPYLARFDEQENMGLPAAAGIELDPECSDEEALGAVEELRSMFERVPAAAEKLRSKDALAIALHPIDKAFALRAVRGELEDLSELRKLQGVLTCIGTAAAVELASRIGAGEFNPEAGGGV